MRNTQKSQTHDIEEVVLRSFLRVLKEEGQYVNYLLNTNCCPIVRHLLKRRKRNTDNTFYRHTSFRRVHDALKKVTKEMSKHITQHELRDVNEYDHVTMAVNHLLHFILEGSSGLNYDKLSKIGEQTYAMSCNRLFGDSIDELLATEGNRPEEMSDKDLCKFIVGEYMEAINSNRIPSTMGIGEFVANKYGPMLLNRFNDIQTVEESNSQKGFMLGGNPDGGNGFIDAMNTNAFGFQVVDDNDSIEDYYNDTEVDEDEDLDGINIFDDYDD